MSSSVDAADDVETIFAQNILFVPITHYDARFRITDLHNAKRRW